jgi:zinc transporter ZupT
MEFGFLLLGGMILIMGIFEKVKALKEANKALLGLKIPIGIVVFLTGLASFKGGGRFVFPGIMGVIAGVFLILDLFKLIPEAEESVKKAEVTLSIFQIPVGVIAVIAAIYGLFVR